MDDNTAAIIFWVVLLIFVSGIIALVVWLMSRRRTTEVIVQQPLPDQWYQQPQQPQIGPPPLNYQTGYQRPANPSAPVNPPVVDAPAAQTPPRATRRASYRELLQEGAKESEDSPGQGGLN